MIYPANPALDQAPESFNGVRVNVANYIDLFAVVDALVFVSTVHIADPVVSVQFIGEHGALRQNVFLNHTKESGAFDIACDQSLNSTFALDDSDNRSFHLIASHRASGATFALAAHIGFINLDAFASAADRTVVIGEHGANLFEHSPCSFVGYARLAFNLFRRYAATGSRHEVHRVEPGRQRSGRFVENRPSGRMNVIAAMIAAVRWTAHNAVMLRDALAILAKYAIGIKAILEPFQTGRIVGELCLERF